MFFLGLTFSLLLIGGGAVLFMKGMTLYAIVLAGIGFVSLLTLIIHYQKRSKRRNQQGEAGTKDCGLVPDCAWIPDCDDFDCIDLPDCELPDCDVPDCDCSPDCSI